jgi:hypothetical protein
MSEITVLKAYLHSPQELEWVAVALGRPPGYFRLWTADPTPPRRNASFSPVPSCFPWSSLVLVSTV